jgi:hypothetical protein
MPSVLRAAGHLLTILFLPLKRHRTFAAATLSNMFWWLSQAWLRHVYTATGYRPRRLRPDGRRHYLRTDFERRSAAAVCGMWPCSGRAERWRYAR